MKTRQVMLTENGRKYLAQRPDFHSRTFEVEQYNSGKYPWRGNLGGERVLFREDEIEDANFEPPKPIEWV